MANVAAPFAPTHEQVREIARRERLFLLCFYSYSVLLFGAAVYYEVVQTPPHLLIARLFWASFFMILVLFFRLLRAAGVREAWVICLIALCLELVLRVPFAFTVLIILMLLPVHRRIFRPLGIRGGVFGHVVKPEGTHSERVA
ncbi:hypothetical protein E7T06_14195 [Deinococcus sp. Arct2-2]|uniref:hypothetical protein n=1 Tax=Deinococcus sp. Arct2-2 TaxID=2568653 RepID=UPI0010A55992|nr:hypothetical protein [Deinococcus sp. Arct2-2]THF68920.1 hypothetical protein E7T06_14195 [Deinococcus sp. Arct2-2]